MLKTQSRMNHHKESSWEKEGVETGIRGWVEDIRSTGPKGAEGRGSPQRDAEGRAWVLGNAETPRQGLQAQDIMSSNLWNMTVNKELKPD